MADRYYVVEGDIRVYYAPELDGGGTSFGQMFVPVLRRLGLGGSCYEPFSGPAFIGFSLLGAGICDELVVSDVNPRVINYVKLTTEFNGLSDRVRYYVSNLLENIPSDLRFDLVIANPPHFRDLSFCSKYGCDDTNILKTMDKDFALHRAFYHGIVDYLRPGGSVVFVENSEASSPEDFKKMITESGLRFRGAFKPTPDDAIYAIKVLINNSLNKKEIGIGRLHRLITLTILKSPNTLLKHAPLPSIKQAIRDMQKFYFIWSSKD